MLLFFLISLATEFVSCWVSIFDSKLSLDENFLLLPIRASCLGLEANLLALLTLPLVDPVSAYFLELFSPLLVIGGLFVEETKELFGLPLVELPPGIALSTDS
jgi:hypothetical protein